MQDITFSELSLPTALLQSIDQLGYETPSAIQAAAIPLAQQGHDILGLSQTGSGKTAAFLLPSLSQLDLTSSHTQILILTPTRELAQQVSSDCEAIGGLMRGLKTTAVYGGAPIHTQIKALTKGSHVVVGTPGRLLDHLRRSTLKTKSINIVILDEADRMLDMGFRDEMEELLSQLPKERQSLFFSATMNRNVQQFISRHGHDPKVIEIENPQLTVDTITQRAYEVGPRSRLEVLNRIISIEEPRLTICFANTKRLVDETTEELLNRGYQVDRLHGDCTQMMRERTLKRFRDREIKVLVATDVAARGLDVEEIDLVVNLELPQDPEDYVHRIGRTGRAGRDGLAVSFLSGRDMSRIRTLERTLNQSIERANPPSPEEVENKTQQKLQAKLEAILEKAKIERQLDQLQPLLAAGIDPIHIAAASLRLLQSSQESATRTIPEDDPNFQEKKAKQRKNRKERGERSPRNERFDQDRDRGKGKGKKGDRFNDQPHPHEKGMTRLYVNVGKAMHVKPGDFVGMFYNETPLEDGSLGKISLHPKHSLIDVPSDQAQDIIRSLKGAKIRGKDFKVDIDRSQPND